VARLIARNVYSACFPLHEGEYDYGDADTNADMCNVRRVSERSGKNKDIYGASHVWIVANKRRRRRCDGRESN